MNAIVKHEDTRQLTAVLQSSLYPGAKPESVELVLGYCRARGLDPMLKPVHIVPMWIKGGYGEKGGMRDVVLPGIALYRIQAARTGSYAGKDEPEFGPDVTGKVGDMTLTYPTWCKVTVYRIVGGQKVGFTAKEYWLENYANAGRDKETQREKEEPNAMWKKRAYGQLAKCAEAQALRQAFPEETGGDATAEEMEGKVHGPIIEHEGPAQRHQPAQQIDRGHDGIPSMDDTPRPAQQQNAAQPSQTAPAVNPWARYIDSAAAAFTAAQTQQDYYLALDLPDVQYIKSKAGPNVKGKLAAITEAAYKRIFPPSSNVPADDDMFSDDLPEQSAAQPSINASA